MYFCAAIMATGAPQVFYDATSFDAEIASYTSTTEDFSGILNATSATSFDLTGTTPPFTIAISGGTLDPSGSIAGSTATDGAFLGLVPSASTGFGTVTLTFAEPIEAVSFYLYDLNDTTSTVTRTTITRDAVTLWEIVGSVGNSGTGTLTDTVSGNSISVGNNVATFFGYTDFGNAFSSIVISNISTTIDNAAIDNVTVVVPEPATVGLWLAVAIIGYTAVRRRIRR
jgi:hypothetical protein